MAVVAGPAITKELRPKATGAFPHAAVKFCKRNFFEGKELTRGAAFAANDLERLL
jgi:hypothetical protein